MFKKPQLASENIPFYIVLAVLFISFSVLIFVLTFQVVSKNSTFMEQFTGSALNGVQTKIAYPNWSFRSMMDTSWQKQLESWLAEKIPVRKVFIRAQNQLFHSLFSKSYMYNSSIIIGKNNYLYENAYVAPYCNPNQVAASEAKFERWAHNLQLLSDYFAARGQRFIYVITPSKAAYFPEYLPDNYRCVKNPRRPNYYQALVALKKVNVAYFDASEFMMANKAQYGELLFPRGGTHWTSLGAALSVNELLSRLSTNKSLQFSYQVTQRPHGFDKDLLSLENLLFPDKHYPIPLLSIQAPSEVATDNIAIVGGSFCHQMAKLLSQSGAFNQVDHYYYFSLEHLRYLPGKEKASVDITSADTFDNLFSADVVLLEENESILDSVHAGYFIEKVLGAAL